MSDYLPKWHQELNIFAHITPMLILEGNVLDSYQYPDGGIFRLPGYLNQYLRDLGYQTIAFFDSMQGYYHPTDDSHIERLADMAHVPFEAGHINCVFKGKDNSASSVARAALTQAKNATALVLNLASRYIVSPDRMDQQQTDSFTNLLLASMEARDVRLEGGDTLKNLLIVVVNKLNDLPPWLYLENPNVKAITIGTPSAEEREQLVKGANFPSFFAREVLAEDLPWFQQHPEELTRIQDRFVGLTEGLSFTELNSLRRLCKNEKIRIRNMASVVDLYRYGLSENPWERLRGGALTHAGEEFRRRVKGQDMAVNMTLDVVKRAVTGLSGLQGSSQSRPKGVLFFAGPTGTGKTELAKTLAEKLFGDESRVIRFDMSEYGQPHSDQKLLGAPPGYVGYEAGGQLTNAVRKNPFSILLFDEIDKAHPSILDKFLQILEDGRMTDGQGNTVYFSESVIIFTSNLGIYVRDQDGVRHPNVTPDMPYEEVRRRVRRAVDDFFKLELGRPEILNRIGENIVVFDFIRPEVAGDILNGMIRRVCAGMAAERHLTVKLSDKARGALLDRAMANLEQGGRGVGNVLESCLINPLSRYLYDNDVQDGGTVEVLDICMDRLPIGLVCRNG